MELLPIKTRRIVQGDNLVEIIQEGMRKLKMKNEESDIFVISSKAMATAEGRIVDLASLTPSEEAKTLSKKCGRSPEFCEAVLAETKMRNGIVRGTCPGAIISELKPWGSSPKSFSTRSSTASQSPAVSSLARREQGTIITANAGLDESNTEKGTAVGWPEDPVSSARRLRQQLEEHMRDKGKGIRTEESHRPFSLSPYPLSTHLAVIITDSCVRPRRWGVTAFALAVAGIDPLRDEVGREDLFGRKLRITKEAVADQLATAANMLMGNADQSIPAVIIRDHGLTLSEYEGWVPGIEPEEDLFRGIF